MATSRADAFGWTPAVFGVAGVGLLILVLASGGPDRFASPARLRAETEAAALTALRDAGHPWGQFEVRGDGVGVLSGDAPSPEAQSAALGALHAALADRIGFPGVITRLEVDREVAPAGAPESGAAPPAPETTPPPADLRVEVAAATPPPASAPAPAPASATARQGVGACARAILTARAGRPIRFAPSAAEIAPAAQAVLTDIAAALKGCGGVKVIVEGHTDAAGPAGANLALSLKRAEAARDALVAAGAPAALLEARGLGETRPVTVAANPPEQARNRRITFAVEPS